MLDKRQPDLTVLMERVHKPHNFSAILRSCDAVGVLEAHAIAPKRGIPDLEEESDLSLKGKTHNDTSGSAAKWVRLKVHPGIPEAFWYLKSAGFQVLAAHFSERAVDYREANFTQPTCILLGTEKWGVSSEAANQADGDIIIPMMGMVQSLNVSVAAAVVLFEAQRQRLAAGYYNRPRLSPAAYQAELEHLQNRHAEHK